VRLHEHRGVFRQELRDQFLQPGSPSDRGKMTHQSGTDPLSLVFVDQGESTLSSSGINDVPSTRGVVDITQDVRLKLEILQSMLDDIADADDTGKLAVA